MAAEEIQITLSADDAKAVRAWQRQKENIAAFENGLDGVGKKSKKVADDSDEFGAKALANLGKMTATVLGIGGLLQGFATAASAVSAEINNAVDRQKDAAQHGLSGRAVTTQLFANIGERRTEWGETEDERRRTAIKEARKIANTAEVPLDSAKAVLSDALSSTQGDDTAFTASGAAMEALRLSPEDLAYAKSLAMGSLALRAGDGDISTKSTMGFMSQSGTLSQVASPQDVAATLPRVVAAAKAQGGNEAFAASLYGAATTKGVDTTGDTATNYFTNVLDKFASAGTGKKTPQEQLEALIPMAKGFAKDKAEYEKLDMSATRTDAETRRYHELQTKHAGILKITETGESRYRPFTRDLVTGGEAYDLFKQNLAVAPTFKSGEKSFDNAVDAELATDEAKLSRMERAGNRAEERLKESNLDEAFISVARDNMERLAKAAGDSALQQKLKGYFSDFDSLTTPTKAGVLKKVETEVTERRDELVTPRAARSFGAGGGFGGGVSIPAYAPGERELEQAAALTDLIKTTKEVLERISNDGIKAKVKVGKDERQGAAPRAAQLQGGGA